MTQKKEVFMIPRRNTMQYAVYKYLTKVESNESENKCYSMYTYEELTSNSDEIIKSYNKNNDKERQKILCTINSFTAEYKKQNKNFNKVMLSELKIPI